MSAWIPACAGMTGGSTAAIPFTLSGVKSKGLGLSAWIPACAGMTGGSTAAILFTLSGVKSKGLG